MCPECGSTHLASEQYDYGRCSQTGYDDSGVLYVCVECGTKIDPRDLEERKC